MCVHGVHEGRELLGYPREPRARKESLWGQSSGRAGMPASWQGPRYGPTALPRAQLEGAPSPPLPSALRLDVQLCLDINSC